MTELRLQNRFRTLRDQMLATVLIAVIIAMIIGFGGRLLMNFAVDTWYLTPEAVEHRAEAVAAELEKFVTENAVSSGDIDALRHWTHEMNDVEVLLVDGERALGFERESGVEELVRTESLLDAGYSFHIMPFADGPYTTAIIEHSERQLYRVVDASALAIAGITLLMFLLIYTGNLTRRITVFSRELAEVSGGDLEHPLDSTSEDELGQLARSVDTMRNTIIQRSRAEQRALQANSELITALSHDIRNPLTSLIGYMELLEMQQDDLPEDARSYVSASLDKAYRIRDLTGELFRYFLVFSKQEQDVHMEEYDAQILLEQLLGEAIIDLSTHGFETRVEKLEQRCTLRTDVSLLKRVVDNVVSNIMKYADPAQPLFCAGWAEEALHIRLENRIRAVVPDTVESNHIGLRTCEAILKMLEGKFDARTEGETFVVEVTLPLVKKT